MGFLEEAEIMIGHAKKDGVSKATRVGWIVLARDTLAAALTETKKGVESQDGHVAGDQDDLLPPGDEKPKRRRGKPVKVDGTGIVVTEADERERDLDPDEGEDAAGWDAAAADPIVPGFDAGELPSEDEYEAQLQAHKPHVESGLEDPEHCNICRMVQWARARLTSPEASMGGIGNGGDPTHPIPDPEELPRLTDSRPIEEGGHQRAAEPEPQTA